MQIRQNAENNSKLSACFLQTTERDKCHTCLSHSEELHSLLWSVASNIISICWLPIITSKLCNVLVSKWWEICQELDNTAVPVQLIRSHHHFLSHTAEEAFTVPMMAGPPPKPRGLRFPKMFSATVPTITCSLSAPMSSYVIFNTQHQPIMTGNCQLY